MRHKAALPYRRMLSAISRRSAKCPSSRMTSVLRGPCRREQGSKGSRNLLNQRPFQPTSLRELPSPSRSDFGPSSPLIVSNPGNGDQMDDEKSSCLLQGPESGRLRKTHTPAGRPSHWSTTSAFKGKGNFRESGHANICCGCKTSLCDPLILSLLQPGMILGRGGRQALLIMFTS